MGSRTKIPSLVLASHWRFGNIVGSSALWAWMSDREELFWLNDLRITDKGGWEDSIHTACVYSAALLVSFLDWCWLVFRMITRLIYIHLCI